MYIVVSTDNESLNDAMMVKDLSFFFSPLTWIVRLKVENLGFHHFVASSTLYITARK